MHNVTGFLLVFLAGGGNGRVGLCARNLDGRIMSGRGEMSVLVSSVRYEVPSDQAVWMTEPRNTNG